MTLRVLPEAIAESAHAAEWYENQRPGLGEDFIAALGAAYEEIERHPHRPLRVLLGGIDDREFHQKTLSRFPYKVIYEVRQGELIVVAVAHLRRKPNYWAGRA